MLCRGPVIIALDRHERLVSFTDLQEGNARFLPSPLYSGERGRGVALRVISLTPNPSPPDYRGRGEPECITFLKISSARRRFAIATRSPPRIVGPAMRPVRRALNFE